MKLIYIIIGAIGFYVLGASTANLIHEGVLPLKLGTRIANINSSTDSMGLLMGPADTLIVDKRFVLKEGEIYTYTSANGGHIVHRLVKDCRSGCIGLIFKGDNNFAADPIINESQVRERVLGVNFN